MKTLKIGDEINISEMNFRGHIRKIINIYPIRFNAMVGTNVVCEAGKHDAMLLQYENTEGSEYFIAISRDCENSYLFADIIGA